MNEAKILELALSAGFETDCKNFAAFDGVECKDELLAFARLVAAAERERIIAAAAATGWGMRDDSPFEDAVREVADAIRSRTE